MKKQQLILSLVAVLAFVQLSYAQVNKKAFNVDDSKIALQGYSAVSYIELGLAQRGNTSFKAEHEGLTYYFTSEAQVEKFKQNPSKYLPEYGGFCAFGVYAGAKFRVDPNKFLVRNEKLYFFLYNLEVDALQLWLNEDETTLLKTANDNWKRLKNVN
jgi:YHS domain-containing protein